MALWNALLVTAWKSLIQVFMVRHNAHGQDRSVEVILHEGELPRRVLGQPVGGSFEGWSRRRRKRTKSIAGCAECTERENRILSTPNRQCSDLRTSIAALTKRTTIHGTMRVIKCGSFQCPKSQRVATQWRIRRYVRTLEAGVNPSSQGCPTACEQSPGCRTGTAGLPLLRSPTSYQAPHLGG